MRRHRFDSLRKFEKLEDRRMMAGISFNNHILTINGGEYDDVVEVRFEGDEVVVDLFAGESDGDTVHHNRDEDISDVSKIVFNGLAGNDTLTVDVDNLDSGVTLNNVFLDFRGGANDDTLINDLLGGLRVVAFGDAGRDILQGSKFGDILEGGTGNDDLSGGAGDDKYVFSGSAALGTDQIVGEAANAGTDTLDLANFGESVYVNLATAFSSNNPQYGVGSENLQVGLANTTAIENVIGTAYQDDIYGNSRDNHLMGSGGADEIYGFGGNDTLEGGAGNDEYYFSGTNLGTDTIIERANADRDGLMFIGHSTGLTVDLTKSGSNYAVDSTDLKLTLSNNTAIERVYGTEFDDTIIGNSRDNLLYGYGGDDEITGNAGADDLHGGDDDDRLWTDALDQAYGGAGYDIFDTFYERTFRGSNPRPTRYLDWRLFVYG